MEHEREGEESEMVERWGRKEINDMFRIENCYYNNFISNNSIEKMLQVV